MYFLLALLCCCSVGDVLIQETSGFQKVGSPLAHVPLAWWQTQVVFSSRVEIMYMFVSLIFVIMLMLIHINTSPLEHESDSRLTYFLLTCYSQMMSLWRDIIKVAIEVLSQKRCIYKLNSKAIASSFMWLSVSITTIYPTLICINSLTIH